MTAEEFVDEIERLIPGARFETYESKVFRKSFLYLLSARGEVIHRVLLAPTTTPAMVQEAFAGPVVEWAAKKKFVARKPFWIRFFGGEAW